MMNLRQRFVSRKLLLQISVALLLGMAAAYVLFPGSDTPPVQSRNGVLDLTRHHVAEHPVKLQGEWSFYWNELLTPETIADRRASGNDAAGRIAVPDSWLGYVKDGRQLEGTGHATYRLVIRLGEQDRRERLALRIPTIFHAYNLRVNGELIAEVGTVGRNRDGMVPRSEPKLVFLEPGNDTLELVMQVSNFHHKRAGITKPIELGASDALAVKVNLKLASETFLTASLLVIGLYHLLLYLLRRKDKTPLHFGLFTLLVGIRSLLVGEMLIVQLWPDIPWGLHFKIEYLVLCVSAHIITMYADALLPGCVPRRFLLASRIAAALFCTLVLLTPAIVYTRLLTAIGVMVVIHIVCLMAVLIKAAARQIEGSLIFLLVSVVILVTVANDFLYYNGWSAIGNTSPLGLFVFTVAQMTLISSRFTRAAANEERIARELRETNDRLTELNANLEHTVRERTRALSTAHAELRDSYDRLLLSEQGRKKLLSYITHDLRSPLSSMLGCVEAIRDRVKPERDDQYLAYIRDNTIKVNRMIGELSYLSHLETGQIPYEMKPVRIAVFVRLFYERYELVVRDAGLDFAMDIGDADEREANAPVVGMDEPKMEQALFNLVSNAMKFTPGGGSVRLKLAIEGVRDGRRAVISVQDSGIGIPADQLEQIFDRQYRYVRPGAEPNAEGSGLGLAICREIVQAHEGSVRAESNGETGATFSITLPCLPGRVTA